MTLNRRGVLCVPQDASPELLRLYVDLTARLGVEISGFEPPVSGNSAEDALRLLLVPDMPAGSSVLRLKDGGASLEAGTLKDLARGTEYLICVYPFDGCGGDLREYSAAITSLTVDSRTLSVARLTDDKGEAQKPGGGKAARAASFGNCNSYQRARHHYQQNTAYRVLTDNIAEWEAEAVLSAALRVAMENYETVYPYAVCEKAPAYSCVRFEKQKTAAVKKEGDDLVFCGSRADMKATVYAFARAEEQPFREELVGELENMLAGRNEIGQAAFALAAQAGKPAQKGRLITREYATGLVDREALRTYLSQKGCPTELANFNDGREIFRTSAVMSWEGDDFMEAFRSKVLPAIKQGERVDVKGLLSESIKTRRELEQKLAAEISAAGGQPGSIEILCSYKSGYSWIEERVLPQLKKIGAGQRIKRIKISFSYLMNARGDDTFEDESAPNYGRHMDDPEKFFDIPTRWLQELFPVDELIAAETGVALDDITFSRDDQTGHIYRLAAEDEQGNIIFSDTFDPKYIEKLYIKKYPQIGLTHVTTGWLTAEAGRKQVADERIETDTEKVWRFMEDDLIPELEKRLTDKYGVDGLVEAQPLFNRLQIDINMSEIDRDLGFRQERISTAEALQEDIYFYLLDWFKTYGERECGHELDNVGLIMPEPEIRTGQQTEFTAVMYDDLAGGAVWESEGESLSLDAADDVRLYIRELAFDGDTAVLTLDAAGLGVLARAAIIGDMIKAGVINMFSEERVLVRLSDGEESCLIEIPAREKMPSALSTQEKDRILGNEVIDYEQYLQLLGYYDRHEGTRIFPIETTYKGKKIFGVEYIRRDGGVFYSASKVRNERMTVLFTARHHGNEASSMNSTFMMFDRLDSDLGEVLDRINMVFVPFINIDGGTLHCHVHSKHPKWLCHPARYNSAGFEFRKDFENPHSKYGEARVLRKIWGRYLFDVVTDNHGFEGHELVQPFSGYISPWYKSFWVPRAFYYGYIWFRGSQEHMVKLGNLMRERVSAAINADAEIYGLNKEFAERFEKYAQSWFPDLFRLEKFNEVVFYWTDTDKHPRPANYGVRNPEITAVDWTTELADETAVGEYMGLNARAHHISDIALIKLLLEYEPVMDTAHISGGDEGGSGTYIRYRRHPLFAGGQKEL